jgi:GTP-binding protein
VTLPLVAVVGRPNVGKSTCINRIAVTNETIVEETPGVTRDRKYVEAEWAGRRFILVDTGGLDFAEGAPIARATTEQALLAVEAADYIIFMVDATTGPMPDDEDIAKVLRKAGRPVLLAINKVDNPSWDGDKYRFYQLGLGEPMIISSLQGLGIGDLLDEVIEKLPEAEEETTEEALSVAIVGRPNVGKSSVLNKLLGEERVIVSEKPGTTRDSIDTMITINGQKMRLIDTAGLRRRGKIDENVEYYSWVRALRALDRAQIALLVIDASEGATEQDQRVAEMVETRGCGIVILLNKWDLLEDNAKKDQILSDLAYKLRFINYAPVLRVSALTGKGLFRAFEAINEVAESYYTRISTSAINGLVAELKQEGFAPVKRNKKLKLSYATQAGVAPPTFIFFVNRPELANANYRRFLKGKLRETFGFMGSPIFLRFRKKTGSALKTH